MSGNLCYFALTGLPVKIEFHWNKCGGKKKCGSLREGVSIAKRNFLKYRIPQCDHIVAIVKRA